MKSKFIFSCLAFAFSIGSFVNADPDALSIPTFTVGGFTQRNDEISISQTGSSNSGESEKISATKTLDVAELFSTQTVTGFNDFSTTIGNTVVVFAPEGSKDETSTESAVDEEDIEIVTPREVFQNEDSFSFVSNLEQLFRNFEKPEVQNQEETLIESSFGTLAIDTNDIIDLRPTSVQSIKPLNAEVISTLSNGVIEVDGAEAVEYDKVSVELSPSANEDDFRTLTGDRNPHEATKTLVDSITLTDNFVVGGKEVGIITATGGTLIAHGVTTVHTTRVFGTYLPGGDYAQVVQKTDKVYEDIQPSKKVRFGSVEAVTEKPSFGVSGLPIENLFGSEDKKSPENRGSIEEVYKQSDAKPNRVFGIKRNGGSSAAALNDLKARLTGLRNKRKDNRSKTPRFHDDDEPNVGTGSVEPVDASSFQTINSISKRSGRQFGGYRERSFKSRYRDLQAQERVQIIEPEEEEDQDYEQPTAPRFGAKRSRLRQRPQTSKRRIDVDSTTPSNTRSKTRGSSRFRSRLSNKRRGGNGGSSYRDKPKKEDKSEDTLSNFNIKRPSNEYSYKRSNKYNEDTTPEPNISIKRFSAFSRPDIRKTLLEKILNKGEGKKKNVLSLDEQKDLKIDQDHELVAGDGGAIYYDDEDYLQELDVTGPRINGLQTTLDSSTMHPEDLPTTSYLEVATIRSPYSFSFDDSMSTRYVTVTRTFTSKVRPTKTAPPPALTIEPSSTKPPLFQTETIPAPENILTSTLPDFNLNNEHEDGILGDLASSIETLQPLFLASSTAGTPPLKTVTETFSTRELMLKTSVLPIVVNGNTVSHTLTQSYYVTRLVEAVKTIPPMEAYEFIPTTAFTDLGNILDEAGSEKNEEKLHPGELEFSDPNYLEGPHEIRVPPPPGFGEDLKLIGSKFDPSDEMEKKNNPEMAKLKHENTNNNLFNNQGGNNNLQQLLLQQQLLQQQQQQKQLLQQLGGFNNGGFNNPLAAFSPEQIQQLALLQYLQNPFGGLGGLGGLSNPLLNQAPQATLPQANNNNNNFANLIQPSKPVIRTETLFETSTVPLFFGNKKIYTTLTKELGVTTITEYEDNNSQPAATALPNLNPSPAPQNNLFNPLAGLANLQPSFQVTSQPVVRDTVTESLITKELTITFRNAPTVTTLTSTTTVSTQVTSYVTRTVPAGVAPSLSPGLGGFNNPYAALLG